MIAKIGKEVSTGTSTAAMIEASLHGGHPVTIILIVGGLIIAGVLHAVEQKAEAKHEANSFNKRGIRNYGLVRML